MKLKVKWSPDINQDIDALTNPNSFVYDEKLTKEIIKKFQSIHNFRKIMNKIYGVN